MNYSEIISETESALQELENAQKLVQFQKRVRFLRLLKSGEAATQKQAGEIVGWKLRQAQQIWQLYRGQGVAGARAKAGAMVFRETVESATGTLATVFGRVWSKLFGGSQSVD